jgi:recombination protein RecT
MIDTLGTPQAVNRLISALIAAVSTNKALQACDPKAILYCAFKGESLGLLPLPQFGHYYIIPYGTDIQFQMGYKGYIHLAIKSGEFTFINCTPIKQGELLKWNPVTEEIEFEFADPTKRDALPTIGFYGSFKLKSGFSKGVYWTIEQIQSHASKFSKNTSGTFWGKNFDAMGRKTVLKTMLSTYGSLAPEITNAVSADMQTINTNEIIEMEDFEDGKVDENKGD